MSPKFIRNWMYLFIFAKVHTFFYSIEKKIVNFLWSALTFLTKVKIGFFLKKKLACEKKVVFLQSNSEEQKTNNITT